MQNNSPSNISDLWHQSRLLVSDKFESPPVVLKVDDSIIGTLGNFSASTGKAKSKKTFNVCAIVASALTNGAVLSYIATLPEIKRKILYVDTEQSPFHCQRVLKRILLLAGLSSDSQPERLEFLSLRRYAPNVRLQIIEEGFDYFEVPEAKHKEALENLFSEACHISYSSLITKLQTSYKAVGYSFGVSKAKKLKVFLENKRMIVKEDKFYRYNHNFNY